MKLIGFVLLPLLIQVAVGLVVMSLHKPGGEFVGLGVMLMGMVAIPLTALLNWLATRAKPPLPLMTLVSRTLFTTLVFPALSVALYLFAS